MLKLIYKIFGIFLIVNASKLEIKIGDANNIFEFFNSSNKNFKNIFNHSLEIPFENVNPIDDIPDAVMNYSIDVAIKACNKFHRVYRAHFDKFVFDQVRLPWRTILPIRRRNEMAKYFGIDRKFLNKKYQYLYISLTKIKSISALVEPFDPKLINKTFLETAQNFQLINFNESRKFFENFGTHYVSSFVKGHVAFQVLVYTLDKFSEISDIIEFSGEETPGREPDFYSKAVHIGKIMWMNDFGSGNIFSSENIIISDVKMRKNLLKHYTEGGQIFFHLEKTPSNPKIIHLRLRSLVRLFDENNQMLFRETLQKYISSKTKEGFES